MNYQTRSILLFFGISTVIFVLLKTLTKISLFTDDVVLVGNFVIFIITYLSITLLLKALYAKTNHQFMNAFYGNFMMKFLLIAICAFIYIYITKKPNKNGLFLLFGVYLVYTFLETTILKKSLKLMKDAERKTSS